MKSLSVSDSGAFAKLPTRWVLATPIVAFVAITCSVLFVGGWEATEVLLRDPAAVYDYPVSAGLFSYLGILGMTATSAILLVAFWLLRPYAVRSAGILLHAGLLSAYVALDDLFMWHEEVLRDVLHIRQRYVMLAIGLAGATLLWRVLRQTQGKDILGFWASLAFLAGSVVFDMLPTEDLPINRVLEDAFKFAGLLLWIQFWIAAATSSLREQLKG